MQPKKKEKSRKSRKESEIHLLPLLGVPHKHPANSRSIYSDNLAETHVGFVIAASVSVPNRNGKNKQRKINGMIPNYILLYSMISDLPTHH